MAPTPELEGTSENSPILSSDRGKDRRPREERLPRRLALRLAVLALTKPSGCLHTYAPTGVEKFYSLATAEACTRALS